MSNINIKGPHQDLLGHTVGALIPSGSSKEYKRKPLKLQLASEEELRAMNNKPKANVTNWKPAPRPQVWNEKEGRYESTFKHFIQQH